MLPFSRRPPRWALEVAAIGATAGVALAVWAAGRHGPSFEVLYVLVAVWAAYAFVEARSVALHVAVCTLAAALPVVYRADTVEQLTRIVVLIPAMWVAAAVVRQLRAGVLSRHQELSDLARRDPLTGAGNRRLLAERLRYELTRHRRTGRPLAVVALDLDGFKEVNDVLGHLAGDRLLAAVAARLRETVRDADTVVRFGGDEFCVVAPETDRAEAEALAGRIEGALASLRGASGPLTASSGIAVFPGDGTSAGDLLAAADAAERRAKSGRHRQLELIDEEARAQSA